ncbi:hypothetical protein BGX21_000955 [Mortierella sp. AD011]|nr:hypothetical protein BGX20_002638 [Mortierella sp. AD010]KAF9385851.1 hypothetical protein BGX21_000955 [Mortierella sp. AD011]
METGGPKQISTSPICEGPSDVWSSITNGLLTPISDSALDTGNGGLFPSVSQSDDGARAGSISLHCGDLQDSSRDEPDFVWNDFGFLETEGFSSSVDLVYAMSTFNGEDDAIVGSSTSNVAASVPDSIDTLEWDYVDTRYMSVCENRVSGISSSPPSNSEVHDSETNVTLISKQPIRSIDPIYQHYNKNQLYLGQQPEQHQEQQHLGESQSTNEASGKSESPVLVGPSAVAPSSPFSSTPSSLISLSSPPTDSISSVCSWLGDIVPTLTTLSCPAEGLLSPTAVRFNSADTAASTNLDESNLGIKADLGFQHNPCLLGDPHSILPTEEISRSLLHAVLNTSRADMAPYIPQSTILGVMNFPMTAAMPSGLIDHNDITGIPQGVRLPPCPEGGLYAFDTMTAPQSSIANMEVTWDQVVGMYPATGFSNLQAPDVVWDFVNSRTPFSYDQIHSRDSTKAPLPDTQTKQVPMEQYNRRHTQPQLWIDSSDFLNWFAWENSESQSNLGTYASSQRQHPHLQQPQLELQSYINIGPNPNLKQAHYPFLPSSPTQYRSRQYKPYSVFVASPTPLLKRRRRLTQEESEFLLDQFRINERPTVQEREAIAKYLKLDKRTIQVWFQNRRAKLKRDERDEGDGNPCEEHECERLRAQRVKTDLSPAVSEDVADDEDGSETEALTSINAMENEGLNLDDALEDYYWLESSLR